MRSATSRRIDTPGRSDEDRDGRGRAHLLQNDQISDLPEPQSQSETGLNAILPDPGPEMLDVDEPMRPAFASEEDPQHINNGKDFALFKVVKASQAFMCSSLLYQMLRTMSWRKRTLT